MSCSRSARCWAVAPEKTTRSWSSSAAANRRSRTFWTRGLRKVSVMTPKLDETLRLGQGSGPSVEPVPPDHPGRRADPDDRVELPAALLDHRRRPEVGVLAGHQHPVRPDGTHDDQALAQDLGRVPAPPKLRPDAVADVPALQHQRLVELVPDRCTADHGAADDGHQEGARHPPGRQADPLAMVRLQLHVIEPRHAWFIVEREREAVALFHLTVAG